MKEYTTKNNTTIKAIGRNKSIKETPAGRAYFVWNNTRYYMDEVMRLSYPVMWDDENGKLQYAGGYISICNTFGVLVEVSEYCDYVQLWEEIE